MKDESDYKKRVDTKTRNTTSRVLQNTQKQLRGQREQTMSTMSTQHASAVRMI